MDMGIAALQDRLYRRSAPTMGPSRFEIVAGRHLPADRLAGDGGHILSCRPDPPAVGPGRESKEGNDSVAIYSLDGQKPEIPEGEAWIAPDATVVGKVRLLRDASVWFAAVLRGDNEWIEIGEGSNVQDGSVLHTDPGSPLTIGRNCTIGHKVMLHGCTIGDGTLVGMSATILNGAKIGRNCLIGAHALIPERKEIPDNSLVMGAPAKVMRELDPAMAEVLEQSAAYYVANWKRFAKGLIRLDG